jgi:hypothetical protein
VGGIMRKKEKLRIIITASGNDYSKILGEVVRRKCHKCKRNIYPSPVTISEAKDMHKCSKIIFSCMDCAKKMWKKLPEKKRTMEITNSVEKAMGASKEMLKEFGKHIMEEEPDGYAG